MTEQGIAEPNTILRAVVGSQVHGLELEGTDDRDEMGVCIEPPEYVIGLKRFEQWTYRTQPEGVRSGPGDLDLTVYSLRKYMKLALGGNPTILLLLYAPNEAVVQTTYLGTSLRAQAQAIASRRAGRAFLGYLVQQKQRLLGERGQKRTKRPELEEAHGYDTKYAMHMVRLGLQGIEYMETGKITLPMPEHERTLVMAVRRGDVPLKDLLDEVEGYEAILDRLLVTSDLPEHPDTDYLNHWLSHAYREWWGWE